jgi:hypothetical protein
MRRTEFKHYLGPAIRRDRHERIHDAIPARRHRVALGEERPRWLIDLESKLDRDVRRECLYASAPRGAPHAGATRDLADPGRERFDLSVVRTFGAERGVD